MNGRPWRCDHSWVRDDATTAQCLRCQKYAPAAEVLGGQP